GAQAVKVEGGVRSARTIEAVVRAGIPVMGHIGWTPQAANQAGKVRVLGKTREQARTLLADALAGQEAGAFAIGLALVREHLGAAKPDPRQVPTIGMGAGPATGAQVQVTPALLGLASGRPKHPRAYADLLSTILGAPRPYAPDVEAGTIPGPA